MRRLAILLALTACGEPAPVTMQTGDACGGSITTVPTDGAPHVDVGTPIRWTSNPPTSGPHYEAWAVWDRHYEALERGYWVHNLEHGGVVFAYRCDAGCPELVVQLGDLVRALPTDPSCAPPTRHRVLVVADPALPDDMTVAAVAWGAFYTGSCADSASLTSFYVDHFGRAPEDFCHNGAALGGTPLF